MGLALWRFVLLGSIVGQLALVAPIILIWGAWGWPSEIFSKILERLVRRAVLEGLELLFESATTTTTFYGQSPSLQPWTSSSLGTIVIGIRRSVVVTAWGWLFWIYNSVVAEGRLESCISCSSHCHGGT